MTASRRPGAFLFSSSFTLVELLVAVAVVAVLGALAFPALQSARNRALEAATASNMRGIGAAILLYVGEHDNRLPGPAAFGVYNLVTVGTSAKGSSCQLGQYLAPYLDKEPLPAQASYAYHAPLLDCPALPAAMRGPSLTTGYAQFLREDYLPANPDNLFGSPGGSTMADAALQPLQPKTLAALTPTARRSSILTTCDQQSWQGSFSASYTPTGMFHGGRLYLFVDGSVAGPLFTTNAAVPYLR